MTAVMLLGDFSPTGILRDDLVLRFNPAVGEQPTLVFIDWVGNALRERGAVIVIYPSWQAETASRLLSLSRSAHHTDRVAGVPLDLPPLALSLLADQLAFAAPYVGPGRLASLAHTLATSLHAGAWVSSVTRLEHIKTGFGSHLKSYLPSSSFSVMAGRDAGVHRITAAKPLPELSLRALDPVIMITSNEGGDTQWLENQLRPALRVVSVNPAHPQPMSAEYWGSKKFVEFVAFSGNPRALNESLAATVCTPCGWCGEPTALATCPFCTMVQPETPVVSPPAQPPAPGGSGHVAYQAPAQAPQPQQAPYPQQAPPSQSGQKVWPQQGTGPQPSQTGPQPGQTGPQPVQQPYPNQQQPPGYPPQQQMQQPQPAHPVQQPQPGPYGHPVQPTGQPSHYQQGPAPQQTSPHPQPQPGPQATSQQPQFAQWPPQQPQQTQPQPSSHAPQNGQGTSADAGSPAPAAPQEPKQAPAQFGASHVQADHAPGPHLNGHSPARADIPAAQPDEPKSQGPPERVDPGPGEADDDDASWPGRTQTVAFGKSRNS